jgi:ribosomal protein S19E (S16A)
VTSARGDKLVRPEEISTLDTLVKGLGFTPTNEARRQGLQSFVYDNADYFKERGQMLQTRYINAVQAGHSVAPMVDDWRSMQAAMREKGLIPAPLGDLYKAPGNQLVRQLNKAGGVEFNKETRSMVQRGSQV